MAKIRKFSSTIAGMRKKQGVKRVKSAPIPVESKQRMEVVTESQILLGRYSNHIQVSMQKEEFVLDFFAQGGSQMTHQSRIFIAPAHAARLLVLLKRQVQLHKKKFGK